MIRLFADTFFFFAFLNAADGAHREAAAFYDAFDGQLVTTEWVLTELADGLAGVTDRQMFVEFHRALRSEPNVKIIPADSALFADGLEFYAARLDKEWSLTDCISFVVMKREGFDGCADWRPSFCPSWFPRALAGLSRARSNAAVAAPLRSSPRTDS